MKALILSIILAILTVLIAFKILAFHDQIDMLNRRHLRDVDTIQILLNENRQLRNRLNHGKGQQDSIHP